MGYYFVPKLFLITVFLHSLAAAILDFPAQMKSDCPISCIFGFLGWDLLKKVYLQSLILILVFLIIAPLGCGRPFWIWPSSKKCRDFWEGPIFYFFLNVPKIRKQPSNLVCSKVVTDSRILTLLYQTKQKILTVIRLHAHVSRRRDRLIFSARKPCLQVWRDMFH